MLYTLWSKTYFTETPRYILFSYMLSTDSLQLIWSLLAYLVSTVKVNMSNGMCAIFLLVANMLTRISPLNLAVMALERYAAICFPLRHAEIATSKRAGVAIGTIWILASLNALSEFFLFLTKGPPFHLIQIYCLRRELYESNVYIDLNNAFTSIYMVDLSGGAQSLRLKEQYFPFLLMLNCE
ncbi:olfactory receptor-like protein OLF4 [Arapaima gigas]